MKLILSLCLISQTLLIAQEGTVAPTRQTLSADQEMVAFARGLLEKQRITDAELQSGLKTIQNHVSKMKNVPEKEFLTYAQGILEERTNQLTRAVVTFRRFERAWPKSQYMPEANYVLGLNALNQKSLKDAETRFRRVIESDLPIESKFNAQGLLVWCLLDQKRMQEAIPLVHTLFPIGRSKPDERALVAIMEVQCETKSVEAAKKTRTSYLASYRDGAMKSRVNLMWGLLLGQTGRNVEAARALRDVIRDAPKSEQADEARLALATLLADGKLPDRANPTNDSPDALLAQLTTEGVDGHARQRALFLRTNIAYRNKQWDRVMTLTEQFRNAYPESTDFGTVQSYRIEAIMAIVQEAIDGGGLTAALPHLNGENIGAISPQLRSNLVSELVKKGLPEAATKIIQASPETEQADLRQLLTQNISEPLPPPKLLASLGGDLTGYKGELGQIHILLSGKKWNDASIKIEKLTPGADRIKAILALLMRPMPSGEIHLRRNEAEGWLAKSSESSQHKEPLAIFIADLYMQANNPREALALYPLRPQPEHIGWVSLMRATALANLGQTDEAKRLLNETSSVTEFKQYRQMLLNQLNK